MEGCLCEVFGEVVEAINSSPKQFFQESLKNLNSSSSFCDVQESQVSELQLIWQTKEKDSISCLDCHVFFKLSWIV